ncbi:MAG: hypothetical protein GC205_07465, partial [Bacteroidetes bacterium]|nr:hypothetical protein [Bacteroidota bacterium]
MFAAFFRIIRPVNQLILAFAQVAAFAVLTLLGEGAPNQWATHAPAFGLLLGSTLLICAAGNMVNDLMDRQADAINKPGRNPVGRELSLPLTRALYSLLTAVGVGIGLTLGLARNLGWVSAVPAAAALVLWAYSRAMQHWPFAGNLAVALLVSLTVLLPAMFFPAQASLSNSIVDVTLGYFALLAGLSTWTREWVKDLEDRPGDKRAGSRTAALVLEVSTSKRYLYALLLAQAVLVLLPPFDSPLLRLWGILILAGYVVLARQLHRA